jgi:hypothetical protein
MGVIVEIGEARVQSGRTPVAQAIRHSRNKVARLLTALELTVDEVDA